MFFDVKNLYYCRGVLSGAAMAPPALHLRENTRSRRQGRRHDPLGRTIGGLDQQRANGSQYNADPHRQLYSRADLPLVVFAPRLYVKQRHSLAKPTQHLNLQ